MVAAIALFVAVSLSWTLARADVPSLDVTKLADGVSLRDVTYVFEDPGGKLDFAQVRARDRAFQRTSTDTSFGFTMSALWVRFDVDNPSSRARDWLLELPYPHLDEIDIYIERAEGVQHIVTGDMLPFANRQVDHPNFIFEQEAPAQARVRYYLRARSTGVVRVPLTGWLTRDFISHDNRMNLALWIFYGAALVMAWYNIAVTALLRKREHLYFSGLLVSMGAGIFTLSGQTFQFLLPNQPVLANRMLTLCIAIGLLFIQLYSREIVRQIEGLERLARPFRFSMWPNYALLVFGLLAPKAIGLRVTFIMVAFYIPFGLYVLLAIQSLRLPELRWTVLSFYCLVIAMPLALLAHAVMLPSFGIALWAGHIGCAAYSVIATLALPERIKSMSEHLAGLNIKLSDNVHDLKRALARAEELTEAAQRATKVKDEFMATMSHELRTPLNAIINVPQGLLRDFPEVRGAECTQCGARYLLDDGEQLAPQATCDDCARRGTLREAMTTKYAGTPAQTAHFLRRIERSGQHLLQMVNGVLDYSKMQAGRLELELTELDLRTLLTEGIDELSELAASRGIAIELQATACTEPALGDAVRLRQVLRNLLANALKFSEANSVIRVKWERDENADVVSIVDQGIGVAPEDHERIFASFEQVHKGDTRRYGGTGLGLSISRSLVRMHGGELWVESQLGKGSSFKFRLPRGHFSTPQRKQPA